MNYVVDIDKDAIRMLAEHTSFLRKVSYKAALKLNQEFYNGVRSILENPEGYPYLNEKQIYRKYLFYRRYLIIYLIEKTTIYIDYIIDTRQNYFQSIY